MQENFERSPHEQMFQLLSGYWVTRAIQVAAELDIAEHLRNGPQRCDALAAATQTDAASLYRLLRALASVGIFAEGEDTQFELTSLATTLLKDSPDSLRGNAVMQGDPIYWQSWGELEKAIKTGEPVFDDLYRTDFFSYLAQHPDFSQRFDEGMAAITMQNIAAIIPAYDFSEFDIVVDVGGGTGELLNAILKAIPRCRGILLDRTGPIEQAKKRLQDSGLIDRCALVSGNFFDMIPSGGDIYILKNILHDWSDEQAIAVLWECRKVMGPGQKLLIIETVIPTGNQPSPGKFVDLQMMLFFKGGRERTEAEFRNLLDATNFSIARVISTSTPRCTIIEVVCA